MNREEINQQFCESKIVLICPREYKRWASEKPQRKRGKKKGKITTIESSARERTPNFFKDIPFGKKSFKRIQHPVSTRDGSLLHVN